MLELVLRLRFLESSENFTEQERKSQLSRKAIKIGLVVSIVVTIGIAIVFIGLLVQMTLSTDFQNMDALLED